MPIFEFRCLKCGNIFEKLFIKPDEEVTIECPDCQSDSFERVISRSNYAMGMSKGGSKTNLINKSCSSGNKCSTLEVPGYER